MLVLVVAAGAAAQTLSVRTVATGLDTPWEILWGPDGWLWVTERAGHIRRIHPETGEQHHLATLADVYEQGESGLLGMALHPNFADSPHVFVAYTYREGSQILERIVRLSFDGSTLGEMRILLDRIPGATIHNGCRLLILHDRTLLVTTGDANNASRAQDLQSLSGKVLRIRLDGTIPPDNPFPSSPVWSLGHRNAQGLAYGRGILYSSEHGPNSDDEINILERGRNYGWPSAMGYCDAPTEQAFCAEYSVVEPIRAWTPTIAPCGLAYYDSDRIPEWKHSLLLVTLKAARLVVLRLDTTGRRIIDERHYLVNQLGRLRAICVSPDGRVFIGTSNRDGRGSPQTGDDRIVELSLALSSVEEATSVAWQFHPEPIDRAQARLRVQLDRPQWCELSLLTTTGALAAHWTLGTCIAGEQWFELDTSAVASGVYIAVLNIGTTRQRRLVTVCR
jgi:glucose/arabinose dehydrogenase